MNKCRRESKELAFPLGLFLGHEIRQFLDCWTLVTYISFSMVGLTFLFKVESREKMFPAFASRFGGFLDGNLGQCMDGANGTSTGEVYTTLSFL